MALYFVAVRLDCAFVVWPLSQDITLTKALEDALKPYGVFESEEELQHR